MRNLINLFGHGLLTQAIFFISLFILLIGPLGGIKYLLTHLYTRITLFAGKNYLALGALVPASGFLTWYSYHLEKRKINAGLWIYFLGILFWLVCLMLILDKVPEMDYQHGRTYLALLLSPILRIVFPSKPISPAGLLTQTLDPALLKSGTSVPPSLVGELYMNFSVPGILIGMFLFGLFWQILYSYMQVGKRNREAIKQVLSLVLR